MAKKAVVIGAGFSGLSAATFLANKGFEVDLIERHSGPGGRARTFTEQGFTFDMGPSWYWMPDIFDRYFNLFGKKTSDYYKLKRLDPSYSVVWGKDDITHMPADMDQLLKLFDELDPGSGLRLKKFLEEAAYKYKVGVGKLVFKPGNSLLEFADLDLIKGLFRLDVFTNMRSHVAKVTSNRRLREILEFPVLFLGALPQNTPALYSLMNYADMSLGTWFPEGGMFSIVDAMEKLAKEKGVKFYYNQSVKGFEIENKQVYEIITEQRNFAADVVISSADYHHTEGLLPANYRNYSEAYWEKRVMAPSSILYYLGINKRIEHLPHHTLFFDQPFDPHAHQIYTNPSWPDNPLFYVSLTTKTDKSGAPDGFENMFVLIPVAAGLKDTPEIREHYYHLVMNRMESLTGQSIKEHVIYRRDFACNDFVEDYSAFKGNAYGLANTLMQTAILKPSLRNKRLKNLFYTGQLTVPGPGVPPSLISGEVVASEVHRLFA